MNFLRKIIIKLIDGFKIFQYNNNFKYASILGGTYFVTLFLKFVFNIARKFNIYYYKLKKYGNGYVVFCDGSKSYVIDISVKLLKQNPFYKIILIGQDEQILKHNVFLIIKTFSLTNLNLSSTQAQISVNYILFNDDIYTIKQNIPNYDSISIIFFNNELRKVGTFHKISEEEVKKFIKINFIENHVILRILNESHVKVNQSNKKILYVLLGDLYSKYKLPGTQLYSAYKKYFNTEIAKQHSITSNYDVCYIEDFFQSLYFTNSKSDINIDLNKLSKSTYIYTSNILWHIAIKINGCLIVYKMNKYQYSI